MTGLWDHVGLAASAFLSATVLPGTSEATLVLLAAQDPSRVWSLLLVASLFNTLGSVVTWWLGLHVARFAGRRWFPLSPQKLARGEALFKRFGLWSLLFAWLPIVGDGLALAAGVLRVGLVPFTVLVGLGKAARYAALLAGFLSL
jgi:membrane protein YqaA with SNARE-associated domain